MHMQKIYNSLYEKASYEVSLIQSSAQEMLTQSNISIIQPALKTVKAYTPAFQKGIETITSVALWTFKIFCAFSLFAAQTTTFLIGAAIAMVYPEAMRASIDRISAVWKSLPFALKVLAFVPFPFAWASYFLIASPFVGANVSLYFQDRANVPRQTPTPLTPPAMAAAPQQNPTLSSRLNIFLLIKSFLYIECF